MTQKRFCAFRGFVLLIVLAALLALRISSVEASWLIDAERFHMSAHGQTSCLECHDDIAKRDPHPNPANVNKTLDDFFRPEQCEDCHADVFDEIDRGAHGGVTGKSRRELVDCVGCHEPHYAMSSAARKVGVDPAGPAQKKCSTCHEYRDVLPRLPAEDEPCMGCHLRPAEDDPKAVQRISNFCFGCHGANRTEERPSSKPSDMALIDEAAYPSSAHSGLSCLVCHPGSAQYRHAEQASVDCLRCHVRHDEKVAHDAHLSVSCQACHLKGITPVEDSASERILWRIDPGADDVTRVHQMVRVSDEAMCRHCHVKGNSLGAAAMVLPAKSVICMPCHPATLSIGDTTTRVALLVFLVGFVGAGSVWLSGSLGTGIGRREENKAHGIAKRIAGTLFSTRLFFVVKALLLDGLLQRRLFTQSKGRWAVHALIFLPLVSRFAWGLAGLVASLYLPDWNGTWFLLDKNRPAAAFLFDLTGGMVMFGVLCAVLRRVGRGPERDMPGLPRPDWAANGLLAGILLVGFVLEGMRIAMTGSPPGAQAAFVGYRLSRLLTGVDLTRGYGYVWYTHAILTGAFVAYLPFSRMIHMITAPISLALNAGSKHKGQR